MPASEVQVVPIVRIRRQTTTWSYLHSEPLTPGTLVRVPFRGRPHLAVVWFSDQNPTGEATENITEVLATNLIHPAHLKVIEHEAKRGFASYGSTLYTWAPPFLRSVTKPSLQAVRAWKPLLKPGEQHLVVVPQRYESHSEFAQSRSNTHVIAGPQRIEEARSLWLTVAAGASAMIIGKDRATFLPFRNLVQTQIFEPFSPAYLLDGAPHTSLVRWASLLASNFDHNATIRSHLASEAFEAFSGTTPTGNPPTHALHIHPGAARLDTSLTRILLEAESPLLIVGRVDRLLDENGTQVLIPGLETIRKECRRTIPKATVTSWDGLHSTKSHDLVVIMASDAALIGELAIDQRILAERIQLARTLAPTHLQTNHPQQPLLTALTHNNDAAYWPTLPEHEEFITVRAPLTEVPGAKAEQLTEAIRALTPCTGPHILPYRDTDHWHIIIPLPFSEETDVSSILGNLPNPWHLSPDSWHVV